jgi:hypothetical protein
MGQPGRPRVVLETVVMAATRGRRPNQGTSRGKLPKAPEHAEGKTWARMRW